MDFIYLIKSVSVVVIQIFVIYKIWNIGENPPPLPHSEKPKIEYIETIIYTLILIIFLFVDIFFISSFLISLCFITIIYLLIPLVYVRYRDQWTREDLGFSFKIKNQRLTAVCIILSFGFGVNNTLGTAVPWNILLIYIYSNAFLEEFLFRGIIQSKLARVFDQKKAIILQALLFMSIHIPVNSFNFLFDNDIIKYFLLFTSQFIYGIFFGLIYLKTRNIGISVIVHYLTNWFGAIVTLFLYI